MSLLTNLVSYWKLDESSGDALDAQDLYDLADAAPGSAAGLINTSRSLDGASQYFDHADNADFSIGGADATWSAWVWVDSLGKGIILAKDTVPSGEYYLYLDATDHFALQVFNSSAFVGVDTVTATSFGTVATGAWYFVVAWHDATNNLIGISVNDASDTTSHAGGIYDGTGNFHLGNDSFSEYWAGRIDEVGFWRRVLTSQERTDLYNGGAGLPYSSLGGPASSALTFDATLAAVTLASSFTAAGPASSALTFDATLAAVTLASSFDAAAMGASSFGFASAMGDIALLSTFATTAGPTPVPSSARPASAVVARSPGQASPAWATVTLY